MSYDIRIGNAELEAEWAGEFGPTAEWEVRRIELPDAPHFPHDFQPGCNERSPGYSQWADFCRATGLYEAFFGDGSRYAVGWMTEHPGIVPLTAAMLETVCVATARWRETHSAEPGFDFSSFGGKTDGDDGVRGRDPILARLLWLEWWMDYALRTCERPAIYNR